MRITGVILALGVGVAAQVPTAGLSQVDLEAYVPDPLNGEVVFHASGCAACHAVDGSDDLLAGGMEIKTRFGTLYSPNITPHPTQGIGNWSRADFVNAVQKGLAPDGSEYFGAVFPFPAYARMRAEDVLDLHAYILTLPQSDTASREHQINFLDRFVLSLWSEEREPLPALSDPQMQRGAYLVEAMGHCSECHSGRTGALANRMDPEKKFAGEIGMLGEYAGPINAAQLAQFAPEDFVNGALVEGMRLSGLPMTSTTMRRISRATAQLSHADRVAIYAYLTGSPVDPASVTPAQVTNGGGGQGGGGVVDDTPAVTIPDRTGAIGLAGMIDAYCSAPEPEPAVAAQTAAPAAASSAVDPALEQRANGILDQH